MLMMTATSVPLSVMMTSSPVAATVRTTVPSLLRRSLKLWVLMCTHVRHVGRVCAPVTRDNIDAITSSVTSTSSVPAVAEDVCDIDGRPLLAQ
jgi:hypothetical protein